MNNTSWVQEYEQQSIARAGCAMCAVALQDDEVYACEECASMEVAYRDPDGFIEEEDGE